MAVRLGSPGRERETRGEPRGWDGASWVDLAARVTGGLPSQAPRRAAPPQWRYGPRTCRQFIAQPGRPLSEQPGLTNTPSLAR
jgi:hypothetical protein